MHIRPNRNDPTPRADTTTPIANPFLAGIWLEAAFNELEKMNAFPKPKLIPINTTNTKGDSVRVDKKKDKTIMVPPKMIPILTPNKWWN